MSWVAFLVVSIVLLAALRPVALRHTRAGAARCAPARRRSSAATPRSSSGSASDEGCVRLDGEIWTARPYDEDQVFEAGTRVQVLEIRGATALVAE